jgi:hypothetical protein
MTTLTINVPDKEKKLVTQLIKKLGGEVISVEGKLTSTREKTLSKMEEGLSEVKSIQQGKTKGLTLGDVLNQ